MALIPGAVAGAAAPGPRGPHGYFFRAHGPHGFFTGPTYDCTGGTIPPGVYGSMIVTGTCYMPAGNITVLGNVTVAPNALLDAVTKGDPSSAPVVPATVDINGNVSVGDGAVFVFGCSPNITCTTPPGITYDRIGGNLTATGAQGVVLHSATIGGNVSLIGGGGGPAAEQCAAQTPTAVTLTALEPWSEDPGLDFVPVYSDAEDDSIGGNLTVSGLTSCWLGSLRNQVGGSATFTGNTMGDPDAMEIDDNVVNGNMTCLADSPAVQFGDSGSAPNIVGGIGIGQCGFNVTALNPAPEATEGPGIPEHVTVSAHLLRTSVGTFSSTTVRSLTPVTTSSGDTIVGELEDFTITGTGLVGSGTVTPAAPPGQSGAAFLATVYPNGAVSFTVYITCHCSYGGQTGTITLRAYGTTSPRGVTSGTFLITSGGGPAPGSLTTLAGDGSFTNAGEPTGTVRLVEHLAIT
jgi:hypothetical protein